MMAPVALRDPRNQARKVQTGRTWPRRPRGIGARGWQPVTLRAAVRSTDPSAVRRDAGERRVPTYWAFSPIRPDLLSLATLVGQPERQGAAAAALGRPSVHVSPAGRDVGPRAGADDVYELLWPLRPRRPASGLQGCFDRAPRPPARLPARPPDDRGRDHSRRLSNSRPWAMTVGLEVEHRRRDAHGAFLEAPSTAIQRAVTRRM
jgi:hypothetical protein